MSEWYDISTAPKDGTEILGYANGVMTTVSYHKYNDGEGYWSLVVCGAYAEDGEWYPTHWMPLPPCPKEIEE